MISTFVLVLAMNALPDPDSAPPFSRVTRRLTQTIVPPGVDTLQHAFNAAAAGDVLVLQNGNYTGSGSNGVLTIDKDITIRAEGGTSPIIDGENVRRGILIENGNVVVEGLAIANGVIALAQPVPQYGVRACLLSFP